MISKISIGSGVGGTLDYLMNEEKHFVILDANGLSHDKKEAKKEFRMWASASPTLGENVLHIPISFSPDDRLRLETEPQLKQEIIDRYINLMSKKGYSLNKTQYMAIEHQDTNHPHFHLVFNRVDANGKTIKDNFIGLNSKRVCQQITQEFNLTVSQKRTKKYDLSKLKGKDLIKGEVFNLLFDAKKEETYLSLDSIKKNLNKKNIELKLVVNESGKIVGSYYSKKLPDGQEVKVKTSAIDKEYTLSKLLIEHQKHQLRESIQNDYKIRRNNNAVIKELTADLVSHAAAASRMTDNFATLLTLGLFQQSKPLRKFESPFAKYDEKKLFRDDVKADISKSLHAILKKANSIDDLKNELLLSGINVIHLPRQNKILFQKEELTVDANEIKINYDADYIEQWLDSNKRNEIVENAVISRVSALVINKSIQSNVDILNALKPLGISPIFNHQNIVENKQILINEQEISYSSLNTLANSFGISLSLPKESELESNEISIIINKPIHNVEDLTVLLKPYYVTVTEDEESELESSKKINDSKILYFEKAGQEIDLSKLDFKTLSWLSSIKAIDNAFISAAPTISAVDEVKQNILELLHNSSDQTDFKNKLESTKGITAELKYDSNDELVGVRFFRDKESWKGSELGLSAKTIKSFLPLKSDTDSDTNKQQQRM